MSLEYFEDVTPNPEYLIKSIAEQGYTLETALADLIDNSISANCNKVDVYSKRKAPSQPLRMFITDNGDGMSEEELTKNLRFPSSCIDENRGENDLGRFGLGLKTASFSQTRKFTVISRKKGTTHFSGRTWDVDLLKKGAWKIIKEPQSRIQSLINSYTADLVIRIGGDKFTDFNPNTFIIWEGMFKFDEYYVNDASGYLNKQLTNTTVDYLGTVFHKFIESKDRNLVIRVNNHQVDAFDPFRSIKSEKKIQPMQPLSMKYRDDYFKMQGYVLPVEALKNVGDWTTKNKSLADLEGIYIYREDRLIFFGGWNELFPRGGKNRLARIRINVGNKYDNLLHLNVAKSNIKLPFELRDGVLNYCHDVRAKAVLEASRRGLKKKLANGKQNNTALLEKFVSTKNGVGYKINKDFSVLKLLSDSLNPDQTVFLKTFLVSINTLINNQKSGEVDYVEVLEKPDENNISSLIKLVEDLIKEGYNREDIFDLYLSSWGYSEEVVPNEISNILKDLK